MASLQLIGVFAATTAMLSGCGGGTTTPSTDTTTTPSIDTTTIPSIDTTTIPSTATTTTIMENTSTTMAPDAPTQTIAGLAVATKDLSTLVTALSACGLVEVFNGTKEYTVFAPVNSAFKSLGEDVLSCLLAPVGLPTLTSVLEYHVVNGVAMAKDLSDGAELPTLDGTQTIMVGVADSIVTLNKKVKVIAADIEATNGVVHEVDGLLIPLGFEAPNCGKEGSIADLAVATPILKTLVAALSAAGLVDAFNGTSVYTVFAPTDAAFAALGDACVATLTKPANKAALTEILKYHVVDGYDLAADIADGLQVPTLDADLKLTFAVAADGGVTIDGSSKVVKADNYATNGVVHVIDAVLVPPGWANPCAGESNTVVV